MRVPGWKERLREAIAAAEANIDAFGPLSCCDFVGRCVQAITGIDHVAAFGDHRSPYAAGRILRAYGGVDGIATAVFGRPVPPNLVREGDVLVADLDAGPTLGICQGLTCAFIGPGAIVRRSRHCIRQGWQVD